MMQQAYRVHGQVAEDGTLTLRELPFHAGEEVEVIVLAEARRGAGERPRSLRGEPLRYEDPFTPVAEADWESAR